MALPPRAVVVSRPSELEGLVARHGTWSQARFFLASTGRERDADAVTVGHQQLERALHEVQAAIPLDWRRARVARRELDRFLFEPEDIVVAVGQDGLVANVAKYLRGQPVLGINPSPDRFEGTLVRHRAQVVPDAFSEFARGALRLEARAMVAACTGDGQRLVALNEIFVGHASHQSARYRISYRGASERHSSSGLIVATGTGASGWARSISLGRPGATRLPGPLDPELAFFVREAWPSVATDAEVTDGALAPGEALEIVSEMDFGGTVFGDGVEDDHLALPFGQSVRVTRAVETLNLVR